jgi:hypothetical protein
MRHFKQIFCDDISEFESYMPSHAVRSLCARSRGFAEAGHALYDPLVLAGAPLRVSDFAQTAAVQAGIVLPNRGRPPLAGVLSSRGSAQR